MSKRNISLALLLVTLSVLLLYFVPFHGSLSNEADAWGDFGSYIGGVLSGLLAPVTIYFVYQAFATSQAQSNLERKQADLEIVSKLYSDLIQEIGSLQYRRLEDRTDKNGILYTGVDAIYQFDERHHDSPNSVLNHLNSIIKSFEYLILMVNKVKYKYKDQREIMLTKVYLLYYSKISWPVGHGIYHKRSELRLDHNPDYPMIMANYLRLTRETQKYLEERKQIGKPITDWMIELLKETK